MIKKMRSFIAVVETGSFSEASKALHTSQPAISQDVKALETKLQVKLLDRHTKMVSVTPVGQYVYMRAKLLIKEIDETLNELRRITEKQQIGSG